MNKSLRACALTIGSIGFAAFAASTILPLSNLNIPLLSAAPAIANAATTSPNAATPASSNANLSVLADEADEANWIEINLDTPGNLGVEILYQADKLADVTHLRVFGSINDADWQTIINLLNIQALDLSGATFYGSIPNDSFYNRTSLTSILLPEGIGIIGSNAFRNTRITSITIPKSVTYIANYAFEDCSTLEEFDLKEGSNLVVLGNEIFYRCSELKKVNLNCGLTQIPNYAFYACSNLEVITPPAGLTKICDGAFYQTPKLANFEFPETLTSIGSSAFQQSGLTSVQLPSSLSELGNSAFATCGNLKEVTLPEITAYTSSSIFNNCTAIEKITCPAAIAPTMTYDIFSNINKASVNLIVPDFGVVSYKLDNYWKSFENIQGGYVADSYKIAGELSLSNNRRIEGAPSLNLLTGSCLTIGGDAPQEFSDVTLNYSWDYYQFLSSRIISNTQAVTPLSTTIRYSIYSNQWYFFTLPFDCDMADILRLNAHTSFAIRSYDGEARATNGTGGSWKNVAEDATLHAGEGYILQAPINTTFTFPAATPEAAAGVFSPNAVTIPLQAYPSENSANAGWNYVGNPYAAYYDMYYAMLTSPVTIWNHSSTKYEAFSMLDDNLVLMPMQPFFIQASDELSEIEFATAGRQNSPYVLRTSNRPAARDAATSERALFNLTLLNGADTDATRIVLNPEASELYEPARDANKFFSTTPDVCALYTLDASGNQLAINERPETDESVALGLYLPAAGSYTLQADRIDGSATLYDALTATTIALTPGQSYTFTSEEAGNINNRFSLRLKAPLSTGVDQISGATTSKLVASPVEGGVILSVEGSAAIYAADGSLRAILNNPADTFVALPAGLHIIATPAGESLKIMVK